ncbi:sulfite exporter TauE/SafE family protein [Planctomycetales bacterium ZRK34]|nr:sulfite exporter TauE/SafE family protein [Planctomycetales bacterium ZRK34]
MQKVSRLPGLRRRRVRVWLMVVGTITLLLAAQVIWPTFRVMPQLGDGVGPGAFLAVFLAALICEYVDSSLGMGYGTTLTPLLLLAGFSPLQIVPCVLCSEFITGALSGLFHHRDGNVNFLRDREARSTVVMLSMLSVVGAIVAVTLALSVPKVWLTGIIGVMVLSIGVVILATIRRQLRYRRGHLITLGAVAAFNKGLSGGGYGPLVTAGQVVSGVKAKHAVAITSIAESLTCLVGLVAYFVMTRGSIDTALLLPLVTGAVLSVPIATLTVRRIPDTWMRSIVGVMTCLLGLLALSKLVW